MSNLTSPFLFTCNHSRGYNACFAATHRTVSVYSVLQMRGGGYADVLPALQVPDNKADAVPCKRLPLDNTELGIIKVQSLFPRNVKKHLYLLWTNIPDHLTWSKDRVPDPFPRCKNTGTGLIRPWATFGVYLLDMF